jgi:N-acetylmuramoyl-L-alanine amidase
MRLLCAAAMLCAAAARGQAPPAPQAPAASAPHYTVLIDAAHGGEDGGARISDAVLEKNITLAVGVRLRSLLSARGIDVAATRESDKALDVSQRAEIASRAAASACILLHATASGTGIHLFISSLPPAVAERGAGRAESRSSGRSASGAASSEAVAGFSSWKSAQAQFVRQSSALAASLNSTFSQAGIPVTLARTRLPGLDSMACPAVAVELAAPPAAEGGRAAALAETSYQARIAELLAAALIDWRAEAHRQ